MGTRLDTEVSNDPPRAFPPLAFTMSMMNFSACAMSLNVLSSRLSGQICPVALYLLDSGNVRFGKAVTCRGHTTLILTRHA